MIHKITLLAAAITMATPGASAASEAPAFREYFSDSTLRLDYQFGGDAKTQPTEQKRRMGWKTLTADRTAAHRQWNRNAY